MTLVSDIITRAYREPNIITKGAAPTDTENNEALPLLNSIILSSVGFEISDGLNDIAVGGATDQASVQITDTIPANSRLLFNLTQTKTYKLNPYPQNGERFAIADVAGNFSTYNLIIDGNGKTIELDTTELFNTDGFVGQWIYTADVGDWIRVSLLELTDDMPFSEEFDDYFTLMLAARLCPRHGVQLSPLSMAALKRARAQINSRFATLKNIRSDVPTIRLLSNFRFYGDANFSLGLPYID
jgi:hypothetical protein